MLNFNFLAEQAQQQPAQWESTVLMLLVMGLMLFVFWFMGRKQRKQQGCRQLIRLFPACLCSENRAQQTAP